LASVDQERREFFRLNFSTPVRFKAYEVRNSQPQTKAPVSVSIGKTRNVSQTGILFQTETKPPRLSSILWMSLDMRTLKICQEIESKALIFNDGVIGKVVRVEEAPESNAYDVGVCFLRQDQRNDSQVQEVLNRL